MSVQVRSRRESAAFLSTYVGAQGELLVDTTNNRVQVHDGAMPGGFAAAKLGEVVTNTRTGVADVAYTALTSDRTIAVTSLTLARTITLPQAAAYPTGTQLLIFDESGACSATAAITIARAGSDTINGATSAAITNAYGYLAFECNGAGKWTIVDQTASAGGTSAARTPVADANYTVLSSDRVVGYTSLSAARTVTLPAASAFPVGTRLLLLDESGAASATNTITLARAGSDSINGGTSAAISTAYGYLAVQSNGAGKWTVTDQVGAASAPSRTPLADASYTATTADRLVAMTALTAARTITLPAASAFPTGVQLFVVDETGACSATNTITVARAGTDMINGQAVAAIATAYGYLALEGNGAGKWTIVDQVPAASGASSTVPRSSVRQTVQGGPQSAGYPNFLPSSSASLGMTAQNVSNGLNALTIAAAQGYGAAGQNDVVIQLASNPTWSSLAASSTVYLYINASTGAAGSTTLQPIYQFGGTVSTTNGQFTFDVSQMVGYMGNGTAAIATALVFVGEAVTSASAVTSTIAYAYNGYYDSGYVGTLQGAATVVSKNHNLGLPDGVAKVTLKNLTAENGYTVGQVVDAFAANNAGSSPVPLIIGRLTVSTTSGSAGGGYQGVHATTGVAVAITSANWAPRYTVRRGWGGA